MKWEMSRLDKTGGITRCDVLGQSSFCFFILEGSRGMVDDPERHVVNVEERSSVCVESGAQYMIMLERIGCG